MTRPALIPIVAALLMALAPLPVIAASPTPRPRSAWTIHRVRPGETLQSISMRHYGTTRLWPQIYSFNRDVLPSPEKIELGMELKLPRKLTLPRDLAPSAETPIATSMSAPLAQTPPQKQVQMQVQAQAIPVEAPEPVEGAGPIAIKKRDTDSIGSADKLIEIRVRDGETLQSIAQRYMGSPKFWRRIIQLNSHKLTTWGDLRPGMVLRIQTITRLRLPAGTRSETESALEISDDSPLERVDVPKPNAVNADRQPASLDEGEDQDAGHGKGAKRRGLHPFDDFVDP